MADPLISACLALALAAAPPAAAAPVPKDMSAQPSSPVPKDMSAQPAPDSAAEPARTLPPGPTDGVPTASAAAVPTLSPPPEPDPDPAIPTAVEGPAPAPAPQLARQDPPGACHGSRPCQRLVILGSVSGALGVATVIAGSVLTARPIVVDPDDPTMAITYRPAGTAILTIGIGVLATSLLMTLAAVRASRQARRAAVALRPRPAL